MQKQLIRFAVSVRCLHTSKYTNSAKMPLKFAANLNWLFKEKEKLEDRFEAAKCCGFEAVEVSDPYNVPIEKLVEAKNKSGLQQVLINAKTGNKDGDLGLASLPNRKQDFKDTLEVSIQYAKQLQCKRMHIMAGKKPSQWQDTAQENTYLENMKYAADRLQQEGILALTEAVNSRLSLPGYFLDTPEKAFEYVQRLNHPNFKMQLDIFHLQIMEGNLAANIRKYLPYVGHIQIAQVPDRGEPDSAGEINYDYVFKVLEEAGYDGWIGLEYKPVGDTVKGLKWMETMKH